MLFLTKMQISKIDAFLSRAYRFGFTVHNTSFINLLDDADEVLFTRIVQNTSHCVHSLLPARREMNVNLRNNLNFELPKCRYLMHKKSFVVRSVFNSSY